MMNDDFESDHKRMVDEQIIKRGISDKRLICALKKVPRHFFVPENYKHQAYDDGPLPIGFRQTISQPYIVALMISKLHLMGGENVLEIGTGCGYQTALLSHMVANMTTMEIIPELAESANQTLKYLGIKNVNLIVGDGSEGWDRSGPYDAVLVSAAAPEVPRQLLEQLAEGGRLILPVGSLSLQYLELWHRTGTDFQKATGIPVAFVPLLGKHGWKI